MKTTRFMQYLMILISFICIFICPAATADYPAPQPPSDTSEYGKHFQRSMTLMETSTPEERNTVRILFYGQSIMGHRWHTMVMDGLRTRYPHTDFVVENKALGGFSSQRLVRTTEYDVIPFYPDLLVFHVYGDHKNYENVDLRLNPDSPVVDAGDLIPGINDGYHGDAPDLGAYETGEKVPHYGPRN